MPNNQCSVWMVSVEVYDNLVALIINNNLAHNCMKSFRQQMEAQAELEDFDPLDILNAFRQLAQPSKTTKKQSVNMTPKSQRSAIMPPREPSIASEADKDNLPKKTALIKKQSIKIEHKQRSVKSVRHHNQNSLGRISNISRSIGPFEESQITDRNMDIEQEGDRGSSSSSGFQEADPELLEQLRILEQQQLERTAVYEQELNRQKQQLRKILKNSYRKRIQYGSCISFYARSTLKLAERQTANSSIIKMLQGQEGSLKVKKNKKNTDDEQKLSDAMNKEKKVYLQGLLGRLSKQQEKYDSFGLDQYSLVLSAVSESRLNELNRIQELKNYEVLCLIERVCPNIEEILCMNMTSIQEAIISCYRFNLITPRSKRGQLYQNLKNIFQLTKKLTSTSSSLFFPNNSSLLLPVSDVLASQDQVLIISDKTQYSTTLAKFISRVNFTGGQQGMYLLRYLVRACLKVVEELSQKLANGSAVIIPSSVCLNEKFEFRFRNIIFNEFLFKEFRHLFSEEEFSFFPPQEKPDPSSVTLWSMGVLTYYLYFGVRPFLKYQPYSWSSRECFFAVNQLQIPSKTPASEKAKDFIQMCLKKKANTRNLLEILNEPFLSGVTR